MFALVFLLRVLLIGRLLYQLFRFALSAFALYKLIAMYSVKEIFYTLQGEGAQTGRPALFLRFAGCNLWSGREADRQAAICSFCDTDFVGTDGENGGQFKSATALAARAVEVALGLCAEDALDKSVNGLQIVLTGGEPLLQVDSALIDALHERGFFIAVETNGTIKAPSGLDWVCVSPKLGSEVVQRSGDELKVVYGQDGLNPEEFLSWDFTHFYLQPMDCSDIDQLTMAVIEYCKAHPRWKLSLQSHKILQIP